MAFGKKTVRDIDARGKTVLVSVDYNVPGDETGAVTDDLRVKASLPTLRYLLEHGCALVLISHRGRPEGKVVPELSLQPVAPILQKLLGRAVRFVGDCVGEEAQSAKESLQPGEVLLLENTRFHEGEEANDDGFAKALAEHCDLFVQDAFGNAHREHASTSAVTRHLPSVAGLLLEREADTITEALEHPARPFVAVLGGAKIADKIDLIDSFLAKVDRLLIGGAMANTFFAAQGISIGRSRYDEDDLDEARRILEHAKKKGVELVFPDQDAVVAKSIETPETKRVVRLSDIVDDEMILDIGPKSLEVFAAKLEGAKAIIWNGTLGITEEPAFIEGSKTLANLIANSSASSIVCGGDTTGFIDQIGMAGKFTHVSTGGGASLELMAGEKLPAIEALQNK